MAQQVQGPNCQRGPGYLVPICGFTVDKDGNKIPKLSDDPSQIVLVRGAKSITASSETAFCSGGVNAVALYGNNLRESERTALIGSGCPHDPIQDEINQELARTAKQAEQNKRHQEEEFERYKSLLETRVTEYENFIVQTQATFENMRKGYEERLSSSYQREIVINVRHPCKICNNYVVLSTQSIHHQFSRSDPKGVYIDVDGQHIPAQFDIISGRHHEGNNGSSSKIGPGNGAFHSPSHTLTSHKGKEAVYTDDMDSRFHTDKGRYRLKAKDREFPFSSEILGEFKNLRAADLFENRVTRARGWEKSNAHDNHESHGGNLRGLHHARPVVSEPSSGENENPNIPSWKQRDQTRVATDPQRVDPTLSTHSEKKNELEDLEQMLRFLEFKKQEVQQDLASLSGPSKDLDPPGIYCGSGCRCTKSQSHNGKTSNRPQKKTDFDSSGHLKRAKLITQGLSPEAKASFTPSRNYPYSDSTDSDGSLGKRLHGCMDSSRSRRKNRTRDDSDDDKPSRSSQNQSKGGGFFSGWWPSKTPL
ncbi:hypothetical protein ABW19_dt0205582 [Dactylella cylindrospora]|nr:hypothetical protein ABW19_dt0205582 [Dactylella cylindrospora]